MRYLKTFENHNNYEDFTETEAFIKPNVSYCILQNEVHYNPETRLIAKYNVTDTSNSTQLYGYYPNDGATGIAMFDKIEIDDVEASITDLDAASGQTQLSVGEHTVKYTLKDPTNIINYAFNRASLTTVIIPNSVTSIGYAAFGYCSSLTNITIPNSVVSIGGHIFQRCSSLTSITIPDSVTSISSYAFQWCTSLTSATIGNSVTSVGYAAFDHCTSLASVFISSSVTSIGEMAFSFCNVLTSVDIPNSVTSIGNYAFQSCSGLTSATIGNSVSTIGDSAFSGCSGLTSVTIPNSVTSIGDHAFDTCTSLTSIIVESGNSKYDSRDNCNALIETSTNTLMTGCMNTVIPNSVTSIKDNAFYWCVGLTSITIPNSVTSIGSNAFRSCTGLTSITCNATTAPTITSNTFLYVKTNGTLTVPSGSTGYDVWMGTGNYYLGKYSWTKVEQ